MNLIRCFVAIEIPGELKQKINDYIFSLKQISPKIKWVKAANIHITLKFLGEIEESLLDDVKNELNNVSAIVDPFQMSIQGAGFFPNQKKPRVIWLGLQQDDKNSVFKIHEWIDKTLLPLGFKREKRRFSPHLTIGRIKFPDNIENLPEFINQNEFQSSAFAINRVVLIRSELKPSGAVYSILKTYPFNC